jgi:hypothetical protein
LHWRTLCMWNLSKYVRPIHLLSCCKLGLKYFDSGYYWRWELYVCRQCEHVVRPHREWSSTNSHLKMHECHMRLSGGFVTSKNAIVQYPGWVTC